MNNYLNNALKNKYLIAIFLVFIVFIIQGMWFAASIKYKIPPDESYHFELIKSYADRRDFFNPLINIQGEEQFVLGDITRLPSYLYHYLMSFPYKAIATFTENINYQVFGLRLINLALATMSIFVLYRILSLLKVKDYGKLIILFAFSATGMFIWISAAINYDNLAMLLFFTGVYYLLRLNKNIDFWIIVKLLISLLALSITKYSYIPVISLIIVLSIYLIFRNIGLDFQKLLKTIKFKVNTTAKVAGLIVLIVLSVLVAERYMVNLVSYGGFAPSCDAIHSHEECLNYSIYKRNYTVQTAFDEQARENLDYEPFAYFGEWLGSMHNRLYFYFGHNEIYPNFTASNFMFYSSVVIVLILVFFYKVVKRRDLFFILLITAIYIVFLYWFNLNFYLNSGYKFAVQGRYLLPIIPFIYLILYFCIYKMISSKNKFINKLLVGVMVIYVISAWYLLSPALIFIRGSDDRWYNDKTIWFNTSIREVSETLGIAEQGTLDSEVSGAIE